jgi:hypothetical protein
VPDRSNPPIEIDMLARTTHPCSSLALRLISALLLLSITGCHGHPQSSHTRPVLRNDDRSLTQGAEHALGTADRALDNLDQYIHNEID